MRRLLSATAIIGLVGGFWTALDRRSTAHAADEHFDSATAGRMSPLTMPAHVQRQSSNAVATAPSPVFRQYCVGCHNDRMKSSFGNLSLEGIDVGKVSDHMESLEKVVRKLRKGQMPPEGRPRPDAATLEAFVTSLETALDGAAEQAPNPGRVVSRRLNRAEYVNSI
jgi:hypothetical protein